jgi:hypothetical protein
MLMTDYDANTHHLRAKKEERTAATISNLELSLDRSRVGRPGTGGERFVQPLDGDRLIDSPGAELLGCMEVKNLDRSLDAADQHRASF